MGITWSEDIVKNKMRCTKCGAELREQTGSSPDTGIVRIKDGKYTTIVCVTCGDVVGIGEEKK